MVEISCVKRLYSPLREVYVAKWQLGETQDCVRSYYNCAFSHSVEEVVWLFQPFPYQFVQAVLLQRPFLQQVGFIPDLLPFPVLCSSACFNCAISSFRCSLYPSPVLPNVYYRQQFALPKIVSQCFIFPTLRVWGFSIRSGEFLKCRWCFQGGAGIAPASPPQCLFLPQLDYYCSKIEIRLSIQALLQKLVLLTVLYPLSCDKRVSTKLCPVLKMKGWSQDMLSKVDEQRGICARLYLQDRVGLKQKLCTVLPVEQGCRGTWLQGFQ